MHEDEAILYLLDLGTGATHRNQYSDNVLDKVEEIQEECNVTEETEKELKDKLESSPHIENIRTNRYGFQI